RSCRCLRGVQCQRHAPGQSCERGGLILCVATLRRWRPLRRHCLLLARVVAPVLCVAPPLVLRTQWFPWTLEQRLALVQRPLFSPPAALAELQVVPRHSALLPLWLRLLSAPAWLR